MKQSLCSLLLLALLASCTEWNNGKQYEGLDGTNISISHHNLTNVTAVHFTDENIGYIGGRIGGLYKTTSGGAQWFVLHSGTTLPIREIYFKDADNGFIAGGVSACYDSNFALGPFIKYTKDGGATWLDAQVTSNIAGEIYCITFTSATKGFAVGLGGMATTSDGGISWTNVALSNPMLLTKIQFANADKGIAVGVQGVIFITTNGGATWTRSQPFINSGSYDVSVVDGNTIIAAGSDRTWTSSDFGTSWRENATVSISITNLIFSSADKGYLIGSHYTGGDFGVSTGSLYETNDGGATWTGDNALTPFQVIDVSFPTSHYGYALTPEDMVRVVKKL